MERDARHNAALEQAGWRTIRLWGTDIKRDPLGVAQSIAAILQTQEPDIQIEPTYEMPN